MKSFLDGVKDFARIKIDPNNFDARVAADKYLAFYPLHSAIESGLPYERPTITELNFFNQYIAGIDGNPRFVIGLSTEQRTAMYQELNARNQQA